MILSGECWYVSRIYLIHIFQISLIFPTYVSFLRVSGDDQLNILRRVFAIFLCVQGEFEQILLFGAGKKYIKKI